jgi:hypothetical protein
MGRAEFPRAALAIVLMALALGRGLWAQAQGAAGSAERSPDDGHGHEAERFDSRDWKPEDLARMERLFGLIICACPREGWTKTLSGCPDGCADPQKGAVRAAMRAGQSDEQILAAQEARHGPRVLARASAEGASGLTLYLGPFVVLAVLATLVILLLRRLTRGLPDPAAAPASRKPDASDEAWGRRIEKELESMD